LRGRAAAARLIPLYAPASRRPKTPLPALEDGLRPHLPISVLLLAWGPTCTPQACSPAPTGWPRPLGPTPPLILPMRAAAAGEPRVTLTAPVLRAALQHACDDHRRRQARGGGAGGGTAPEQAPIRAVLDQATVHWAE
jgi:6-phosphogluconolactonase